MPTHRVPNKERPRKWTAKDYLLVQRESRRRRQAKRVKTLKRAFKAKEVLEKKRSTDKTWGGVWKARKPNLPKGRCHEYVAFGDDMKPAPGKGGLLLCRVCVTRLTRDELYKGERWGRSSSDRTLPCVVLEV